MEADRQESLPEPRQFDSARLSSVTPQGREAW